MQYSSKAAALLVLSATLSAQSFFIPDNSATTGGCNVIPFGHNTTGTWSNQIYQQIVLTTELGGPTQIGTICDLAFVPCAPGIRHFDTIEIVLAQTTATVLSTNFSSNLVTNVQTVLKAQNYDWDNSTIDTWNRIGLDKPYLYLPNQGNLVVQITVTGAVLVTTATTFPGYRTGARQRVYSYNWTGTPPTIGTTSTSSGQKIEVLFAMNDLHGFGVGCVGSNNLVPTLQLTGSAQIGQSLAMSMINALPTTPLFHNLAISRLEPGVDLGLAGAPGCYLYAPIQVMLGNVTDPSGSYSIKVQVPNNTSLLCSQLFTQMFPFDPTANSFGITSTNYGRILVGN